MSTNRQQTGKLPPQSLLQQRYVIVGQVGRGGMGAVYQAIDTRIARRQVAIKEMSQAGLSDAEVAVATARFQQEAAILGALSHPNLPHIYDAFSEQERSYLVMDYIDGKNLHQLMKERGGQPLAVAQVLHYAQQLCDVLSYLHQQKPAIVFRDVKPTNIMITPAGQVFLIDFGIARFFKEGQEHDTTYLGSPGYAAPEQHGIAQTSPRTDIYSLGATLHYCLTGLDPYYAKDPLALPPIRQVNPQVPRELEQLIEQMSAYDEQQRPRTMQEVKLALQRISSQAAEHTSTLAPSPLPTTQYMAQTPVRPSSPDTIAALSQETTRAVRGNAIPTTVEALRPTQPRPAMAPAGAGTTLWSPGFALLFGLFLLLTVGSAIGGIAVFYALVYGWTFIIEFGLTVLLLLLTGIAFWMVRGAGARNILALSCLAALVAGAGFLLLGSLDVQAEVNSMKMGIAPEDLGHQLVLIGLGGIALVSCGWLVWTKNWLWRGVLVVLFGGALVCAFMQASALDTAITKHICLLLALVLLIQGILLAVRLKRSQRVAVLAYA